MEGRETRPPRRDAVGSKGKGKTVASLGAPSSEERPTSLPSLEALMFDLSLFEESLLKDPNEEVLSSLGAVYGEEVVKGVQELLKESTPFEMVASLSTFLFLCFLSIDVFF